MPEKDNRPPEIPPEQWEAYCEFKRTQELHRIERFEKVLRINPPSPPWIAYPGVHRFDMFWRMGAGEDHILDIATYLEFCSPAERDTWRDKYPEPDGWKGWHKGEVPPIDEN